MNVQNAVDELKSVLATTHSETVVLETVTSRLAVLRDAYRTSRAEFTEDHFQFLRKVSGLRAHLTLFIELQEDLRDVADLESYEFLRDKLEAIKDGLAGLAVCKRVEKELRELRERLPRVHQQEAVLRESRRTGRIRELEANGPRCPWRHEMVVREGPGGYFWGCGRFPDCRSTKQLSRDEEEFLEGGAR